MAAVGGAGNTAAANNYNNNALRDPPPVPPFLNLRTATAEERAFERDSWTLLQLPTRLPRLDKLSTISGSVKAQQNPDEVVSLDVDGGGGGGGGGAGNAPSTSGVATRSFRTSPRDTKVPMSESIATACLENPHLNPSVRGMRISGPPSASSAPPPPPSPMISSALPDL